jgi:hypothetical protein
MQHGRASVLASIFAELEGRCDLLRDRRT